MPIRSYSPPYNDIPAASGLFSSNVGGKKYSRAGNFSQHVIGSPVAMDFAFVTGDLALTGTDSTQVMTAGAVGGALTLSAVDNANGYLGPASITVTVEQANGINLYLTESDGNNLEVNCTTAQTGALALTALSGAVTGGTKTLTFTGLSLSSAVLALTASDLNDYFVLTFGTITLTGNGLVGVGSTVEFNGAAINASGLTLDVSIGSSNVTFNVTSSLAPPTFYFANNATCTLAGTPDQTSVDNFLANLYSDAEASSATDGLVQVNGYPQGSGLVGMTGLISLGVTVSVLGTKNLAVDGWVSAICSYIGVNVDRPQYEDGANSIRVDWDGAQWNIVDTTGPTLLYHSPEDVMSPHLVTTWIPDAGGLPIPTVTLEP